MDLDKIKIYEPQESKPLIMEYTSAISIDIASFYCPYVPIIDSIRIYGNTVRISNISNKKLLELADNIEFISKIKHSNSCNRTILLSTSIENLVYLKLKGVIHESD